MLRSNFLLSLLALTWLLAAACSGSTKQCPSLDPTDMSHQDDNQSDQAADVPQFDGLQDSDLSFPDLGRPDGLDLCSDYPSAFGCPCEGNADCSSGFCVD